MGVSWGYFGNVVGGWGGGGGGGGGGKESCVKQALWMYIEISEETWFCVLCLPRNPKTRSTQPTVQGNSLFSVMCQGSREYIEITKGNVLARSSWLWPKGRRLLTSVLIGHRGGIGEVIEVYIIIYIYTCTSHGQI